MLTLLHTDGTPNSLEVKSRKTGGWINANPIKGCFVINVGDMMEVWTGGRWKSTLHRVVHRGDKRRVSAPFFLEPAWNARVELLEGVRLDVREEGKEYKVVEKYGDYLIGKVSRNFEFEEGQETKGRYD